MDTKNRQNHVLPLSDYLCALLEQRKQIANSGYVFPGTGKDGHIIEPRRQMAELFDVEVHTINYHLKNVFKIKELSENSVIRNFRITASDGKTYDTNFYNLGFDAQNTQISVSRLPFRTLNVIKFF